jgi:hypothetical protein
VPFGPVHGVLPYHAGRAGARPYRLLNVPAGCAGVRLGKRTSIYNNIFIESYYFC